MIRKRVALLACTNVVGGHEFQAAALAKSLAEHVPVTVFVNYPEQLPPFKVLGLEVRIANGALLMSGNLPRQLINGWIGRTVIRSLVAEFDYVIVSAGAVEAGVAVGVALLNQKSMSMYLPFFFDRVPVWGWKGHLYNCILGATCRLFDRIITINRIQARVIRGFTRLPTIVVTNLIRPVNISDEQDSARLVYIGRLDTQKRLDELLEWLDTELNPIKELHLFGDGPMRVSLERQAENLGHLRCTFFGWTSAEEQDRLIRCSDILVLNSLLEGEPLVIREGRARGMRILVRNIIGTRGVTFRQERFNSKQELIDNLVALRSKSAVLNALPTKISLFRAVILRERGISALTRLIEEEGGASFR
ncbi:MAG TPA: glycosyltransferase family 4 protein [Cellvibrionaceae bacterium]